MTPPNNGKARIISGPYGVYWLAIETSRWRPIAVIILLEKERGQVDRKTSACNSCIRGVPRVTQLTSG